MYDIMLNFEKSANRWRGNAERKDKIAFGLILCKQVVRAFIADRESHSHWRERHL